MWGKAVLFSSFLIMVSLWQVKYWFMRGYRREGWVFLGWMGIAWITGILFFLDFRLPSPTQPLFPNWK